MTMADKISYFTSESVTEGHPDKLCDQISDAILDAMLSQDPNSRCAAECLATKDIIHIAGEVKTKAKINVEEIAKNVLKNIGYTNKAFGTHYNECKIISSLSEQSPDIAQGVTKSNHLEQGAGDQGLMFGFACNETEELMPFPIVIAHKLTERMAEIRKKGIIQGLGPDGKSQVSVKYINDKPAEITAVVIAQQHLESVSEETLRKEITEKIINPVCGKWMTDKTKIHINATGRFVLGGPAADTGLTGRKIIVDTYGGAGRHGGGAFSGKDASKVDRSGAYMARYVAKNIVAAKLADKCEIQVSYSIGVAQPTSIDINTFNTNKIPEEKIIQAVKQVFDFRPRAIIEHLKLNRPIFQKTASCGHFGRNDSDFTWEKTDKINELRQSC
ncbi:MAG: S-adenosylmethionine synthase [Parcubacteria group bacterium GW2011_GWA1_36_12]|nr:MAG: S-adenosylmethionine synthase [Parcubacteria group bacterium GW2011_GWA1_36_12]